MSHTLIGFANPGGKGLGFLIPVFKSLGSNALYAQRVASNGTISDFVEIAYEDRILYRDDVHVEIGEPHFWAFGFGGNDLVIGRDGQGKDDLANRLEDLLLAGRPMLAFEVAEFVASTRRMEAAVRTVESLDSLGKEVAGAWRDLAVLTPDLRDALAKQPGTLSELAAQIVARADKGTVMLSGIRSPLPDYNAAKLRNLTRALLKELKPLYGGQEWLVRIRNPKTISVEEDPVTVYFVGPENGQVAHIVSEQTGWDARVIDLPDLEEVSRTVRPPSSSTFVVTRRRDVRFVNEALASAAGDITMISLEASLPDLRRYHDVRELHNGPGLRIIVPATGLPGTHGSAVSVARTVEQTVAAVKSVDRDELVQHSLLSVFLKAGGLSPDPAADAWASVYDRLRAAGLSTDQGYCFEGEQTPQPRFPRRHGGWARDIMFPGWKLHHPEFGNVNIRLGRATAAALVPVSVEQDADHVQDPQIVEKVLADLDWRIVGRETDEFENTLLELEGADESRFGIQIENRRYRPRVFSRNPVDVRFRLEDVRTLMLRPNASAAIILEELDRGGMLPISFRDICASRPQLGVWSFVGSQLKRFARGQLSSLRTQYMASVIDVAVRRGSNDLHDASVLEEALASATLGQEVHLTWGRVQEDSESTTTQVRLVPGSSNEFVSAGQDLIQPFLVAVHGHGVSAFR